MAAILTFYLGIALERMFSSNSMNSIPEEAQIRPLEDTDLILLLIIHDRPLVFPFD